MTGKEDLSVLAESPAAGKPYRPLPDKADPSFRLTSMHRTSILHDRFSRAAQTSGFCAACRRCLTAHSAGLGSCNPYVLLLTHSWPGPGERSIRRVGNEPETAYTI